MYTIAFEGMIVAGDGGVPADLENHLDRVMEELLAHGATDAAIAATGSVGAVEISLSVEASTLEEAVVSGSATVRAAVHAAGGFTPAWSIDLRSFHGRREESVRS